MEKTIKLRVGQYRFPVVLNYTDDDRIFVQFRYNKGLIAEIKSMEGAKWHGFETPPRKIWSIANSPRNHFQLAHLQGENPYAHYDAPIPKNSYERPLYDHQKAQCDFVLARHYCFIAAEMGVGKTLAAIEAMERSGAESFWYIAPRSALYAVTHELKKWDCKIKPVMMTYASLVKIMRDWDDSKKAPQFVVFDESSRIKNPTAQRAQAAMALANGVRIDWDLEGFAVLMSGAPGPKSPVDFWHQCEVACPGFLREGTQAKFKQRLAIVVQQENFAGGGVYPHIVSWRDDATKCDICGEAHSPLDLDIDHDFKASVNEVALVYKRMVGLTLVQFKKDCLDLPDKIYRIVELKPSQKTLNVAKSIVAAAPTVISGLTLLRELSDGFQYQDKDVGKETCRVCSGKKELPDLLDPSMMAPCDGCGGKGHRRKYQRVSVQVSCPKEGALRDLLDEYDDVGRVIIYGGFTGSIDRCVSIVKDCGWNHIRVDGRGWVSDLDGDHLENFQDKVVEHPRVAFIGQPQAAGMGLTLTASPVIIYYSNTFDGEGRIQSEERAHRPGMDLNRGCTIIDLLHLDTDRLVLENLQKKRKLQSLSLGELQGALND